MAVTLKRRGTRLKRRTRGGTIRLSLLRRRSPRARPSSQGLSGASISAFPAPDASALMRAIQRLGRVRPPLTFFARVSTTRGAVGSQRREVQRGLTDTPLLGGKSDKGAVSPIEPGTWARKDEASCPRSGRRERSHRPSAGGRRAASRERGADEGARRRPLALRCRVRRRSRHSPRHRESAAGSGLFRRSARVDRSSSFGSAVSKPSSARRDRAVACALVQSCRLRRSPAFDARGDNASSSRCAQCRAPSHSSAVMRFIAGWRASPEAIACSARSKAAGMPSIDDGRHICRKTPRSISSAKRR